MFIKYVGGRSIIDISFNRKSHVFNKENNRTLNIQDQAVRNYIFSLPNSAEFISVEDESLKEEKNKLKCEECGFIAKSSFGLSVHQNKHKGGK